MARDRYWEDCAAGDTFETVGRTVTEADVVSYACLSGDFSPQHTDAEFMAASPFGERIAHGMLGIAFSSGLIVRCPEFSSLRIIAFLGMEWSFHKPIRFGDTLRCVVTIKETRPTRNPARGVVIMATEIHNQRGETVQTGTRTLLVERRQPMDQSGGMDA